MEACKELVGLAALFGSDEEARNVALIKLHAKEDLLESQTSDLRVRCKNMRRLQKICSRRVDASLRTYDEIEGVRPSYERMLKRQEQQLRNVRRLIKEVE